MRKNQSFSIHKHFLDKALQLADKDSHVVYLNPNYYAYPYGAFIHVLAFGNQIELIGTGENDFLKLQQFIDLHHDWTFGHFSYDLKNQLEQLASNKIDKIGFPTLHFFIPKHILFFNTDSVEIHSFEEPNQLFNQIELEVLTEYNPSYNATKLSSTISKDSYIKAVEGLKERILKGEIYETNFCQEYHIEEININPLATYKKLKEISPMPFSSFVRLNHRYLLCASPERFLKKEKQKIISQPIKGTARRDSNSEKDIALSQALALSEKERAENIMIVDLVRNDLSHTAIPGTVKAEELCKLYSFPNVHQLISTVTSEASEEFHCVDIIKNAFPMGSMTGAPKIRAMQLIDQYETSSRGLFSGSVGYFTPALDFDFNVVIRSILYNSENNYLSFQAGSAITFYSDAEKEYEECAVKTAAIRIVLS